MRYLLGTILELPWIVNSIGPLPDKIEFQKLLSKCVNHLQAVEIVEDILVSEAHCGTKKEAFPRKYLEMLIECLQKTYEFAKAFNNNLERRTTLYKLGFMKQMPNLLMQETASAQAYIQYLFYIRKSSHQEFNDFSNIDARLVR